MKYSNYKEGILALFIIYWYRMAVVDWIIVALFLFSILFLGFFLTKKASGNIADFFVSGRSLPWWLAGTSILATSFSSDTPLHVTKVVRTQGLAGLWMFWTSIIWSAMIPFLFARLWRRSGIITDCEFIEFRYSGKPAHILRGVMAFYRSILLASITMAWVVLGMVKIIIAVTGMPEFIEVLGYSVNSGVLFTVILTVVAVTYTTASGLWGVVTTDFIEFIIAMGGSIVLAIVAVDYIGGVEKLKEGLENLGNKHYLNFIPSENTSLPIASFILFVILGWANAEADGGGNKAQRFLACKNETHAFLSGLWSVVVKEIFRSWPWYITALASIIVCQSLSDPEMAYPNMIGLLMPAGLKGLLVSAFFAAFLSTIDTHLNLSASYLVNDLYKPFIKRQGEDKHYVYVSRLTILLISLVVALISISMQSILEALKFKGELMAGMGFVCIARWYWWRISAWSEITSVLFSIISCIFFRTIGEPIASSLAEVIGIYDDIFPVRLFLVVLATTFSTVLVTFIAPTTEPTKLIHFYKKIRPPGLWQPVEKMISDHVKRERQLPMIVGWLTCSASVAFCTFGIGKVILAEWWDAAVLLSLALLFILMSIKILPQILSPVSNTE